MITLKTIILLFEGILATTGVEDIEVFRVEVGVAIAEVGIAEIAQRSTVTNSFFFTKSRMSVMQFHPTEEATRLQLKHRRP